MTKQPTLSFVAIAFVATYSFGQLEINSTGVPYTINFDNTVTNVNNNAFTGSGWSPNPNSGQLDSDAWSHTGNSDGNLSFGDTGDSGDYAGGTSTYGESTGGWYAFSNNGDIALGIQPGGSDWTPGDLTLRIQNNTGNLINSLELAYDILCFNDQERSNSFNFSHSDDNTTYINETTLDYNSPETATATLNTSSKSITLTDLAVADGAFYYLRWSGDDISGTGSRDEFAIDNISITAFSGSPSPELKLLDADANPQNCGYTIDFGITESNNSYTDVNFTIENIGNADLEITNFNLTGDFSIVAPVILPSVATPLVVNPSSSTIVTIRFSPLSDGLLNGTLEIINNDNNEGDCVINLLGEGYTPAPNIIVRGVIGANPTIANGSTTTSGLNNTLFASQTINSGSQTKSFRIANETGSDVLEVSNISLSGDTADFYVTASTPYAISIGSYADFSITFQPTTDSGTRSCVVSIVNSDPNKNPYTFTIEGTATCPSTSGTITPTEGPIGTEVTISSTDNLMGATASLNGLSLPIVSNSSEELTVSIPSNVTIGGPVSVELASGCIFSNTFTLIDQSISGCDTSNSANLDNLFISQVTDSPTGSLSYVELYNATNSNIDFSTTNYSLRVYNNGNTSSYNTITLNSGTILQNDTFVVVMGTTDTQCAADGADGSLAELEITTVGVSINFHKDYNTSIGHDFIGLYEDSALIDSFGVLGDQTWAYGLWLGESGATFERIASLSLPNPTFSTSDWNISNWEDCNDVDYSDIGNYDFSTGIPPTVNTIYATSLGCTSTSLNIEAIEGYNEIDDMNDLVYLWLYISPSQSNWTPLSDNAIYSGTSSNTLVILDTTEIEDAQYYCQVMESGTTCYQNSSAISLPSTMAIWDGSSWSSPPTSDKAIIINADYDTGTNLDGQTSFEACSLIVNSEYTLTIANNTYVEVSNDLTVNGNIIVASQGAFVQLNDDGIIEGDVLNDPSKITVEKFTAPMNHWYEYTYWSSPVTNEQIHTGLAESSVNRRYKFTAENYLDATMESNNDNTASPGQDGIDDDGDDWTWVPGSELMEIGKGYASTHNAGLFNSTLGTPPFQFKYTFEGPFNNGSIEVDIYRNDTELNDDNWNLIGNPYPSAFSVEKFFEENYLTGKIAGAIYLWSQNTAPSSSANGNENENFSQADYAIINLSGQTAGGDGVSPIVGADNDRYIPSCQGFFVTMENDATPTGTSPIYSTQIIFNNDMRVKDTNDNSQFFKAANNTPNERLWLNLTSSNNSFGQILISYLEGATDSFDGMSYDAPRQTYNVYTSFYSIIEGTDKNFAIQGKSPTSLNLEEVIPLGFQTMAPTSTQYTINIAQIEGAFMESNTIYLKDNLLNITHNLSEANYSFTSEVGTFNSRFEIVFTANTLSTNDYFANPSQLSIFELQNDEVQFELNDDQLQILQIAILDMLGRKIYSLRANSTSETYNLTNLSQASYIAKIRLSNGQILNKKFIKR
ncbi:choice-of-anchor D domain-containing protein [Mangrovimonas sp. TPBH4]|uniref:choice-of-anchor D domain-containing protein n=1 Tax=Mangrovimonas sp. TPBH4 TaxID=1645914 RepID=UPI0006B400E4|nr:choice-of-anchor D domain-containing protein [Mangrovimonas sp. TPBH4]